MINTFANIGTSDLCLGRSYLDGGASNTASPPRSFLTRQSSLQTLCLHFNIVLPILIFLFYLFHSVFKIK